MSLLGSKRKYRDILSDEDLIAYESSFPSPKRIKTEVPAMEDVVMLPARRRSRATYSRSRGIRKSYRSRLYRRRRPFVARFPYKTEFKYIDTNIALASDTTGAILLLNGSAEGVGPSQHVGRRTVIRSIELKCTNLVTAGTGTDQRQRTVLVYDSQPNGVALTIAEVLNTVNTNAFRNMDYRMRFKILMDKTVNLNASGESGSAEAWKFYQRVYLPVNYDATADATIASISTGSLYIFTIGTNVAGNTAGTLGGEARIRYTDV